MTGNRKYRAYLWTLAACVTLCAVKAISGSDFVAVIKVATAVFIAGNIGEHFAKKGI